MNGRATRASALVVAVLALSAAAIACEGAIIDGGSGTTGPASSASVPPVDVRRTFFGRFGLLSLTRGPSPEGVEISPDSVGVALAIVLSENGTYALDDGAACIRGKFTFQAGGAERGAFSFEPPIGRAGTHELELRDVQVAVADLVPGFTWARLSPTGESNRCDAR